MEKPETCVGGFSRHNPELPPSQLERPWSRWLLLADDCLLCLKVKWTVFSWLGGKSSLLSVQGKRGALNWTIWRISQPQVHPRFYPLQFLFIHPLWIRLIEYITWHTTLCVDSDVVLIFLKCKTVYNVYEENLSLAVDVFQMTFSTIWHKRSNA